MRKVQWSPTSIVITETRTWRQVGRAIDEVDAVDDDEYFINDAARIKARNTQDKAGPDVPFAFDRGGDPYAIVRSSTWASYTIEGTASRCTSGTRQKTRRTQSTPIPWPPPIRYRPKERRPRCYRIKR